MAILDQIGLDLGQGNVDYDLADAQARANEAAAYDPTATYAVNDLCLYEGVLKQCTTAIPVAEAWDATHWRTVTIGGQIVSLSTSLSSLNDQIVALGPYNGLDSTSTTEALSAAQGKVLNDRMTLSFSVNGTDVNDALRNATLALINRTDLPTYTLMQGYINWIEHDVIPALYYKLGVSFGRVIALAPNWIRYANGNTAIIDVYLVQLTKQ